MKDMPEEEFSKLYTSKIISMVLVTGYCAADNAPTEDARKKETDLTREIVRLLMMFGIGFDKDYIEQPSAPQGRPLRFVLSDIPPLKSQSFHQRYDKLQSTVPQLSFVPKRVLKMWIDLPL